MQLAGAFREPIEPVRTTPLYRLSVALVAAGMILLPLAYCGMIVAAGWGWWLYLTRVMPYVLDNAKNLQIIAVAASPLVGGLALVFFLVKPLVAPPATKSAPLSLDRAEAPLLFELVEQLCDAVRCPHPRRIDVDVQINASASLRRGLWSLFGNDLVLTIGLPLANGLTLRQFTGVLAHEFGHFSQGAGMRVGYVIRSINLWLARVVFERDRWDDRLYALSGSYHWQGNVVGAISLVCVWISRRLLLGLMHTGHAMSMLLSRQMEFDADQAEIRTVGSKTFIETSRQLHVLDLANQWAHSDMRNAWNKGTLGDDVPGLIFANLRQIPVEHAEQTVEGAMGSTPGMYDSHPPTGQRIAKAQESDREGVFTLDGDATLLFADFQALSRRASIHLYERTMPGSFTPERLVAIDAIVEEGAMLARYAQARIRYFSRLFDGVCWLRLPSIPETPAGDAELAKMYEASRDEIRSAAELAASRNEAFRLCGQLHSVLAYCDADLKFKPADFDLPSDERPAIEARLRAAQSNFELTVDQLHEAVPNLLAHLANRIACLRESIPESWIQALGAIAEFEVLQNQLCWQRDTYNALVNRCGTNPENKTVQREIDFAQMRLAKTYKELVKALRDTPYPFPESEPQSLSEHLTAGTADMDVAQAANSAVARLNNLYALLLGRIAIQVEPPDQQA